MADYTVASSLADTHLSDRWIGMTVGPVTVNSATPDSALTRVRMTFRLGQTTYKLDTVGDQGITITNASTWTASIAARDDFLPLAGKWKWVLEFWFGQDDPWTLYSGTLRVWDDA